MRFKDDLDKELYYRSQIDYCYYVIKEISKHNGVMQSPLAAMIDVATSFDKERTKQNIDQLIYLIKCVIRCKPKCLANYSTTNDKKFLQELQKLKKQK